MAHRNNGICTGVLHFRRDHVGCFTVKIKFVLILSGALHTDREKIKMSNRCNLGEMGQTKEMVFAILKKKAEIRFF